MKTYTTGTENRQMHFVAGCSLSSLDEEEMIEYSIQLLSIRLVTHFGFG